MAGQVSLREKANWLRTRVARVLDNFLNSAAYSRVYYDGVAPNNVGKGYNPYKALNCSGFVQWVYSLAGLPIQAMLRASSMGDMAVGKASTRDFFATMFTEHEPVPAMGLDGAHLSVFSFYRRQWGSGWGTPAEFAWDIDMTDTLANPLLQFLFTLQTLVGYWIDDYATIFRKEGETHGLHMGLLLPGGEVVHYTASAGLGITGHPSVDGTDTEPHVWPFTCSWFDPVQRKMRVQGDAFRGIALPIDISLSPPYATREWIRDNLWPDIPMEGPFDVVGSNATNFEKLLCEERFLSAAALDLVDMTVDGGSIEDPRAYPGVPRVYVINSGRA